MSCSCADCWEIPMKPCGLIDCLVSVKSLLLTTVCAHGLYEKSNFILWELRLLIAIAPVVVCCITADANKEGLCWFHRMIWDKQFLWLLRCICLLMTTSCVEEKMALLLSHLRPGQPSHNCCSHLAQVQQRWYFNAYFLGSSLLATTSRLRWK